MPLPLVLIVGRPNVGKSSLFNRIVGSRVAVVANREGVTRDLLIRLCHWNDTNFRLMDSGGFIPKGGEELTKLVNEQIYRAIGQSDVIIFLVDANTPVASWDMDLAQLVKKSKKQVFLAVNKAEKKTSQDEIHDFWNLGLGEPLAISAKSGMGISALLQKITDVIPQLPPEPVKNGIQMAILGRPNAGKSTLVNRLLGEERVVVSEVAGTTRDAIDVEIEFEGNVYNLIDTAGLRKKARVDDEVESFANMRTIEAIGRSDVCVLLLDSNTGFSHQDLQIIDLIKNYGKGLLIVLNKWDKVEADSKMFDQFTKAIRERYPDMAHYPMISISALSGKRVHRVLEEVYTVYHKMYTIFGREVVIEFFEKTLAKHRPAHGTQGPPQILRCCQVMVAPPGLAFEVRKLENLTPAYQKYILREAYSFFDLQGVPLNLFFRKTLKLRTDEELDEIRNRMLSSQADRLDVHSRLRKNPDE